MEEYEVGVDGVHFEEGDLNDVKDACGICLIAYVIGKFPGTKAIDEECFKRIPTWITLPSLPFVFWNAKALSKIASFVGKPLVSDGYTKDVKRISYARLLVEVSSVQSLWCVQFLSIPPMG